MKKSTGRGFSGDLWNHHTTSVQQTELMSASQPGYSISVASSVSLRSCFIITTVRINFIIRPHARVTHQAHSLALFMRLISFSSLMASVMSPLIRSFPDMKAMVGFSCPETTQNRHSHTEETATSSSDNTSVSKMIIIHYHSQHSVLLPW